MAFIHNGLIDIRSEPTKAAPTTAATTTVTKQQKPSGYFDFSRRSPSLSLTLRVPLPLCPSVGLSHLTRTGPFIVPVLVGVITVIANKTSD